MTIRAQSADGAIHEFPDGTADAIVDKAMKSYAGENQSPPQGKNDGKDELTGGLRLGSPKDFGKGLLRGFFSPEMSQATASEMGEFLPGAAMPPEEMKPVVAPPEKSSFASTAGEYFGNPASYLGPGGLVGKAITTGASALGSEAAGQLVDESPAARIIGSVAAGNLPRAAMRAVTPLPTDPRRMREVARLRAEGVEPTAAQVTGNRALAYAEQLGDAPGGGGSFSREKNRVGEEFSRASLRRAGINADRATPEVMDRRLRDFDTEFRGIAARNAADIDAQYLRDMDTARNEYNHLFVDPLRKPLADDLFTHAINQITERGGVIDGPTYAALHSKFEAMRRGATDPQMAQLVGRVRRAVDDLMDRSIAANNPADIGEWRRIRREYRNFLVLEGAQTGAGATAAEGMLTPAKIRQGAVRQDRRGYGRGTGDFAKLARSGEQVLTYPGSSGTAERGWVYGIPAATAAGVGGFLAGGSEAAVGGALAGAFAPGAAGRVINSIGMQEYLKNQLTADLQRRFPRASSTTIRALVDELGRTQ